MKKKEGLERFIPQKLRNTKGGFPKVILAISAGNKTIKDIEASTGMPSGIIRGLVKFGKAIDYIQEKKEDLVLTAEGTKDAKDVTKYEIVDNKVRRRMMMRITPKKTMRITPKRPKLKR